MLIFSAAIFRWRWGPWLMGRYPSEGIRLHFQQSCAKFFFYATLKKGLLPIFSHRASPSFAACIWRCVQGRLPSCFLPSLTEFSWTLCTELGHYVRRQLDDPGIDPWTFQPRSRIDLTGHKYLAPEITSRGRLWIFRAGGGAQILVWWCCHFKRAAIADGRNGSFSAVGGDQIYVR